MSPNEIIGLGIISTFALLFAGWFAYSDYKRRKQEKETLARLQRINEEKAQERRRIEIQERIARRERLKAENEARGRVYPPTSTDYSYSDNSFSSSDYGSSSSCSSD